jgi:hypothetical protein
MRMQTSLMFIAVVTVAMIAGCEPKLETGYSPRPLNSTPDERRAYYAPEFTPESHPAKQENTPAFGEK